MKAANTKQYVYIGSYTDQSPIGISLYEFDADSGMLTLVETYQDICHPSFLISNQEGTILYCVSEIEEYHGLTGGAAAAFGIAPETGKLTLLNVQPTYGAAPCYVSVDPTSSYVYTANYSGGNISVFPVRSDGGLDPLCQLIQHDREGQDAARKNGHHAHSIVMERTGQMAIAADLGTDQLWVYRSEEGGRRLKHINELRLAQGAGPRHMAFHPQMDRVYVINELDSTITAMNFNSDDGSLKVFQTLSALPESFDGTSYCADIHCSADGRFVYGSNRGHDSIAVFSIDSDDGSLSLLQHMSTKGKTPRNFAISPDGGFLLAANQGTNSLQVFRIDRTTGLLAETEISVEVSSPVCVKFL